MILGIFVLDAIGCAGGGTGMVDLASLFGTGGVRGGSGRGVGLHTLTRHGSFGCTDAFSGAGIGIVIDGGPGEYSTGVYASGDGSAGARPTESAVVVIATTKSWLIESLISHKVRIWTSHGSGSRHAH